VRESGQAIWWHKSAQLAAGVVAAALLVAVIPLTGWLDGVAVLGLPLGYLLFALPFPLAIAGVIFWFSDHQRAYDHRYDVID